MPIAANAIDNPAPIAMLLAPASPLPAAPHHRESYRVQTGEANAPRSQSLHSAATVRIRGVIGSTATVGGNAATIGAPGIAGSAVQHKQIADRLAMDAIRAPSHLGRSVDKKA
jgi:hypothetical protein